MLRPYQVDAVQIGVWDYFEKNTGNPLLVLPTGTGKSLIIAAIFKRACLEFPGTRCLMLTHVQELIEQNHNKLKWLWPTAPSGIYSAGLKERNLMMPITYAGVQSIAKVIDQLGHIDLVVIDEAHMVSHNEETTYIKVIDTLMQRNPFLKVIGLTATPYRLGLGLLTEGGVFDDISYNIAHKDAFNKLIADGYLAPLVSRATAASVAVEGVAVRGGEYVRGDLERAVDKQELTEAAVREIITKGSDRNHWLVFAAGLKHAENIVEMFEHFGVSATMVDGKLDKAERARRLAAFKSGEIRAMVNNSVLTTGYDFPELDLIAMLRPTMSASLWVQMLGRGTRPCEGKENCLVLDFAKNIERLGPINDPVLPKKYGGKGEGVAPIRLCPQCMTYLHASVRTCPICHYEFPENLDKWERTASEQALIADSVPEIGSFEPARVTYSTHRKDGKPDSMKVTYNCGLRTFTEYVCLQHDGFALKKSHDWWRKRTALEVPATVAEALTMTSQLAVPKSIKVHLNLKYPTILSTEM